MRATPAKLKRLLLTLQKPGSLILSCVMLRPKVHLRIYLSPNNKTISGIATAGSHLPGSASAQHKGDAVSCEYSGQSWEITVSVCSLLENLFIYLSLFKATTTSISNTRVTNNLCSLNHQKAKNVLFLFLPVWKGFFVRKLYGGTLGEGVQSTSFACWAIQRFSTGPAHPHDATELTASRPEPLCFPTSAPTKKVRR